VIALGWPPRPDTVRAAAVAIQNLISGHVCFCGGHLIIANHPYHTTMSGCTLRLTRDSPLRTILVDDATGYARYQIDTPRKIARSVTRIRKFDSPRRPPPNLDEDADSEPGDDVADKNKEAKSEEDEKDKEHEEDGMETELAETSDEIARIYWKWFSSSRIIFRGRITTRREFLPKTGKAKGWVVSRKVVGERAESSSNTRSFMFTGPDGVQYRWALGAFGMNYPKVSQFPPAGILC